MNSTSKHLDVAIIGAGPYGLSAGAHLKAKGMDIRVFGQPMEFWGSKMPEGMLLRSPRVASNLSDPKHSFTLEAYEAAVNIAPEAPLPLDTFVEYGKWFSNHLGSDLDRREIASVDRDGADFRIVLDDGEEVRAKRVVVAAGIGPFRRRLSVFRDFSDQQVIHCYENRDVQRFNGKRVAVIGAGQSALESAAILHEAKAQVEIIARQPEVKWIGQHQWLHRMGPFSSILYSSHDVGPLGISRLVAYPNVVARLPLRMRDRIRTRAVRPAGSRWLPARLERVKITTGCGIASASPSGNAVSIKLSDGSVREVDYVVLGTGYHVDISRYNFLSRDIVQKVKQFDGYPRLASGFRSSVPNLHFIGATAARSYGPLLYFVAGTEFASHELTSHLPKKSR